MNHKAIIHAIGKLFQVLALVLFAPLCIAWFDARGSDLHHLLDPRMSGFVLSIVLSASLGTLMVRHCREARDQVGVREGFAVVTFGWISIAAIGTLPLFVYMLSNPSVTPARGLWNVFTDAFFEIMSGFTTTGASVIADVESLPKGILFWRSLTHWLGGMGIVTLALALFPAFGVAAYQIFRGEVPGPSKDRLKPRLAQTAVILWGVYALLTLVQTILLTAGGMPLFDSICHSFGTMATGGFSTRNASIGAYDSAYFEWVVIVFMFLAGVNFIVHYRILFRRDVSVLLTNREFHFYLAVLVCASAIGVVVLVAQGILPSHEIGRHFRYTPFSELELFGRIADEQERVSGYLKSFRRVVFQVTSITTTTGYSVADWDVWPDFLRVMLVALMFFGGSAGSTAGGIKMIRILVLLKVARRQVKIMVQPRLIAPVKIAGQSLEEQQVGNIIGFFLLFLLMFIFFSSVMALMIPDFTTAATSVAATLCNIGPGLSGVGAMETYAWIPTTGKWVLILCMLLGRLEIYTVLIACSPASWRR